VHQNKQYSNPVEKPSKHLLKDIQDNKTITPYPAIMGRLTPCSFASNTAHKTMGGEGPPLFYNFFKFIYLLLLFLFYYYFFNIAFDLQ
jgi:hypothetical protein